MKQNKLKNKNNFDKGEDNSSPFHLASFARKCVACGEIFERKNLIRIMIENKTKKLVINPDNKTFGRSAYICQKEECIKMAQKKNRFNKALKTQINEDLFEKLKIMLN